MEAERAAFIEENRAVADCLVKAGLQSFVGPSPRQPVQLLLAERHQLKQRMGELEVEVASGRQQASKQEATLGRRLEEVASKHQQLETKFEAEQRQVAALQKEKEMLTREVC